MTTTETELGFTAAEFYASCNEIDWFHSCQVPSQSIAPFLDRCCKVGLLSKHKDERATTRYVPTPLLLAMFPEE